MYCLWSNREICETFESTIRPLFVRASDTTHTIKTGSKRCKMNERNFKCKV
jgi:hypothetical protein